MKKHLTVVIAVAAGFLGGMLSHFVTPPAAFAQAQNPGTREVRAQRFVFVDLNSRPFATFMVQPGSVGPDGWHGRVLLVDDQGRELWSAGRDPIRPLGSQ